jgi:D-alanyl-D-alanine carboxypeptidase/D-alanyl-D-alanine-endopeptidase (penicillin-binding protein 4)
LAIIAAISPQAQTPPAAAPSLATQIAALISGPDVSRDHWGILVTTLDGAPIYALNEAQLFQPDSNAKLFTTAAALALLPPSHVFTTTVIGAGLFLDDGTLRGNISLSGVGDPNLSGRDLPYAAPSPRPDPGSAANDPLRYLEQLADQVKASGVKRVEGDVLGSDAVFPWDPYPSDWAMDDAVWGYAAPVSDLSVADNTLKLTVSPYSAPAGTCEDKSAPSSLLQHMYYNASVTLDQAIPYYTVKVEALSSINKKPTEIQIERSVGSRILRVEGYIALCAKPDVEEIAIDDPAEYAAMAFKQMLIDRGIAVTGMAKASHSTGPAPGTVVDFSKEAVEPIPDLAPVSESREFPKPYGIGCGDCGSGWAYRVLAKHVSAPLGEDIVVTNKLSLNLHAELLLLQLGLAVTGQGNTAQGVRVVRQFLINAGLDPNDFLFYDGSGLSGHDLVTPRAIAKLLSYAAHDPKTGAPQPWFADWKASLPVGGVDGSLDFRFTKPPLKGHVFAKTGTHSEGRALSGYLDCASGRTVVFSILVNNHLPGSNVDRDAMDKIVAAIAAAE